MNAETTAFKQSVNDFVSGRISKTELFMTWDAIIESLEPQLDALDAKVNALRDDPFVAPASIEEIELIILGHRATIAFLREAMNAHR